MEAFPFLTKRQAAFIRRLGKGRLNTQDVAYYLKEYGRWSFTDGELREFMREFNTLSRTERILELLDIFLETFGVEYITPEDRRISDGPAYAYMNQGDSYTTTLFFDYDRGRFFLDYTGDLCQRLQL